MHATERSRAQRRVDNRGSREDGVALVRRGQVDGGHRSDDQSGATRHGAGQRNSLMKFDNLMKFDSLMKFDILSKVPAQQAPETA